MNCLKSRCVDVFVVAAVAVVILLSFILIFSVTQQGDKEIALKAVLAGDAVARSRELARWHAQVQYCCIVATIRLGISFCWTNFHVGYRGHEQSYIPVYIAFPLHIFLEG